MATVTKVLRTFFIDPKVDMRLAQLALKKDVSKNELTRDLLMVGMAPFVAGKSTAEVLGPREGKESEEGDDMVMRSIYLDPSFDDYLRETAFRLRCSKSELMRRFIGQGLEAKEVQHQREALEVSAVRVVRKEVPVLAHMFRMEQPVLKVHKHVFKSKKGIRVEVDPDGTATVVAGGATVGSHFVQRAPSELRAAAAVLKALNKA